MMISIFALISPSGGLFLQVCEERDLSHFIIAKDPLTPKQLKSVQVIANHRKQRKLRSRLAPSRSGIVSLPTLLRTVSFHPTVSIFASNNVVSANIVVLTGPKTIYDP